jgi:hypothetical protein
VPDALSPAADRFLRDCIASALQLDALIILQNDADRWWTTTAIAAQLRTSEASAAAALEALGRSNVVDVCVGGHLSYRYAPIDAALAHVVDEIAAAHYHSRDRLVALLTGTRRTLDAAQRIADAFRIGRKPDA